MLTSKQPTSLRHYAHTISKENKFFFFFFLDTGCAAIVVNLNKTSHRRGEADKLHRNHWRKITLEVISQAHILKLISQASENSAANN